MIRALLLSLFLALPAAAGELSLVMLERPGCGWCQRWLAEIGPAYPRTEEGRAAPLRRVDLTQAWPTDLDSVARDIVTPTFILLRDGDEVGRLRGYPGEDFFWPMLAQMIEEAGS